MSGRTCALLILVCFSLALAPEVNALSFSFSDKDYLGGASWGTMTIDAYDSDTLMIRYDAAAGTVIPGGSQVSGFGLSFLNNSSPSSVLNPADGDFSGDRNDLDWIVLKNLNAIPNPSNGDEFSPGITKDDFSFGVTEGNANNLNPPGILPDDWDVFYLDFVGLSEDLTQISLEDFVELAGIRIQSLPDEINGGSLFLVGNRDDDNVPPVPEPATLFLMGSGLAGLAAIRRRAKS